MLCWNILPLCWQHFRKSNTHTHTHIHTHTCLTAFFPGQPGWAGTRKVNHSGFYWSKRWWGGNGISWTICKSFAPYSRQITTPVPHHSIFMGRMLFLTPNQQCQTLKASLQSNIGFLFPHMMESRDCLYKTGDICSRKGLIMHNDFFFDIQALIIILLLFPLLASSVLFRVLSFEFFQFLMVINCMTFVVV